MDPYPAGCWWVIGLSEQLSAGDVVPLRYFGGDFVLFRTKAGVVHVLDAACPHLGAHLGYGGQVSGNNLQCPFHAWRFDGSGTCVATSTGEAVPDAARRALRSWPVEEHAGLILMHRDLDGGATPAWRVPHLIPFGSPEWTPPEWRTWELESHPQELMENAVDLHHFKHVHRWPLAEDVERTVHGPIFKLLNRFRDEDESLGNGGCVSTSHFGLGLTYTHTTRGGVEGVTVSAITPVEGERVEVRCGVAVKKLEDADRTAQLLASMSERVFRYVAQDVVILTHKAYVDRPPLTESEEGIRTYREWARQFYRQLAN